MAKYGPLHRHTVTVAMRHTRYAAKGVPRLETGNHQLVQIKRTAASSKSSDRFVLLNRHQIFFAGRRSNNVPHDYNAEIESAA